MKRVAEYLIRNETMDGDVFKKVYNGELVPDKQVGEDLLEELNNEKTETQAEATVITPEGERKSSQP